MVAVAPDKELCKGSQGHLLPLPVVGSESANFKSMMQTLNMDFGKGCKLNGLLIKGRISSATFPQVRLAVKLLEAKKNPQAMSAHILWLDSPGGLISEALKIGDLIARHDMEARVTPGSSCYSSCVLIFAAASIRVGIGEVGIHRPFSNEISSLSLSYADYLSKYEALTPVLKNYLSKFGVSPAIVDAMNIVPSDEIRILSTSEMESFGLGFQSVAAREFMKAKTIQVCGQHFHEMERNFYSLIATCGSNQGADESSSNLNACIDIANKKFPEYGKASMECDEKKKMGAK
jgi:hypothetical protein